MENQFKQIAALIGDPTRATIMWTLLDGKAFTATELAIAANTSPQNISMHLAKLVQAGLLCVENQGRHRYYKYFKKDIAYAIEAMATLLPHSTAKQGLHSENNSAIKHCRTCYDHLAGKTGVLITDSLLKQKIIIEDNNMFEISPKGLKWFLAFDIDINELKQQRRAFARPCLDWSERRFHIAGSLGAALLNKMLYSGWIRKTKQSRAVIITAKGQKAFYDNFKIDV
jgi:DNA-binding transcriptional ArsR family regulator